MFGLDHLISGLGADGGLVVVLGVALLLGLRHATDPDHLVAVSTLLATERDRRTRRATRLGLAWGLGHASSLAALGIPLVLLGRHVPAPVQEAADVLVGLVIMALAAKLVREWRRGAFHVHEHRHDGVPHRHLHAHAHEGTHAHDHRPARSAAQAYGVGVLHGASGSAAIVVLLLASIGSRETAVVALAVFAAGTALSMAGLSLGIGYALAHRPAQVRLAALAPALGLLSFAFGAWWAATAIQSAVS
jgi:ABC-type nickel/cobalt efflux system permease component RcnA